MMIWLLSLMTVCTSHSFLKLKALLFMVYHLSSDSIIRFIIHHTCECWIELRVSFAYLFFCWRHFRQGLRLHFLRRGWRHCFDNMLFLEFLLLIGLGIFFRREQWVGGALGLFIIKLFTFRCIFTTCLSQFLTEVIISLVEMLLIIQSLRLWGLILRFVLDQFMHFLGVLVDVLRVLYQMQDGWVPLSEVLEEIVILLVLLDFANIELRVVIILISRHPILLHRSSSCCLVFAKLIIKFGNNFIDELLHLSLYPV